MISPPSNISLIAMWSQPYDLNLYRSFSGVGILRTTSESTEDDLFASMYYESGNWVRSPAGQEGTFEDEQFELRSNLTENTYKTIMLWSITEVSIVTQV